MIFFRSTKHMYNFLSSAMYSSFILLRINTALIVPIPGIDIAETFHNLFSSTISTIFIACSSNSIHQYMSQFMISSFHMEVEIAKMVAQSAGIFFSSSIPWQGSINAQFPTCPLARTIFSCISDVLEPFQSSGVLTPQLSLPPTLPQLVPE